MARATRKELGLDMAEIAISGIVTGSVTAGINRGIVIVGTGCLIHTGIGYVIIGPGDGSANIGPGDALGTNTDKRLEHQQK